MLVYYTVFTLISAVLFYLYNSINKNFDYWRKKKVPFVKPLLIFGNYKDYILLRKYSPRIAQEICQKFPEAPYVGTFYGTDPALIVKDPDLIKLVMAKDFYYFSEREISQYVHREPIALNLFFSGGDIWKVLRQNLTSLFTSAKIKNMFYLIESCARSLETALNRELSKSHTIDVKLLSERFTMDCIGNCAFGISTGTLTNDSSNPFMMFGEKLLGNTNYGALKRIVRSMWPGIFFGLGNNLLNSKDKEFFEKIMTDIFKSRQDKGSSRNDFVDLILSWKEKTYLTGDRLSNNAAAKEKINLKVDDHLLMGQCVTFFGAGFETTATTISFLMYELAKNPEAQSRVIEEVDDYYKRHEGKIEYESLNEMPFLQACVNETLRLYPVLGIITREVSEDYTFPTGLHLEKGTRIHIPVYYLQHNPEYYPEPEEFRPERFLGDAEKNIKSYTYMPFGEGARLCVGIRFAKMPLGSAVLTMFKNHRIELPEHMPRKLDFDPRGFATLAKCHINVKFIPRK